MSSKLVVLLLVIAALPVEAAAEPGASRTSDTTEASTPRHSRPKKKKRKSPRKLRRHFAAAPASTPAAASFVATGRVLPAGDVDETPVAAPPPAVPGQTTRPPVVLASAVQPAAVAPALPPPPTPGLAPAAAGGPVGPPGIEGTNSVGQVTTGVASVSATPTTVARADDHVDVVVTPSAPVSSDSLGILRIGPRLVGKGTLLKQLELSIGGGMTYATQGATVLESPVGAAHLRWSPGRFFLDGGLGVYGQPSLVFAPTFTIGANVLEGFRLALGVHHRPFIEVADALTTDEQAFHNAGVGGASDLAGASTLTLNEVELTVNLAPWPWLYVYADGKGMAVSDGNHGFTVATGTGINLFGLFGWWSPLQLYARWDTYLVGFRTASAVYYSPNFFDGDGVGAELRWRVVNALELSANGGRTLSFATGGSGWFYGAGLDLRVGSFSLQARGAMRDEIYFVSRRLWVGAMVRF
jgi:hypothetical protein